MTAAKAPLWLWLLGLVAIASAQEKPEGCPDDRWTQTCSGTATCQTLAMAGFICGEQDGGVGVIASCKTQCEYPCCITTTTTTTTFTSITTTVTKTTVTSSSTVTGTMTFTTRTVTLTGSTVTVTGTFTVTSTHTSSATSTDTMTTETVTTVATTASVATTPPTTAEQSEGPLRRLTVHIKITDVDDSFEYVTSSSVNTAYRETITSITGLRKDAVDLQMVVNEPGTITVSYILNIPEASMKAVEESLKKETTESFNAKLTHEIDEMVGPGVHTQKVLSIELESDDGTIAVGGAPHGFALHLSFVTFIIAAAAL